MEGGLRLNDADQHLRDLAYLLFLEGLLGGEWVERWAREKGYLDALWQWRKGDPSKSPEVPARSYRASLLDRATAHPGGPARLRRSFHNGNVDRLTETVLDSMQTWPGRTAAFRLKKSLALRNGNRTTDKLRLNRSIS